MILGYSGYDLGSSNGAMCIAVAELLGLALLLLNVLCRAASICCTGSERIRWFAVEKIFWVIAPELSSYSAMRLLHFVTPTIIISASRRTSLHRLHCGVCRKSKCSKIL